jgi:hypothetical protein
MQGKEQNLFTSSDKLYGFLRKIKIWKAKVENGDLEIFLLTADTDPEITSCLILEHISVLEDKLQQYFLSLNVNEYDWVRSPFAVTIAATKHLSLKRQKSWQNFRPIELFSSSLGKQHHFSSGIWKKKRVLSVSRRCPIYTTTLCHNLLVRVGIFRIGLHQK